MVVVLAGLAAVAGLILVGATYLYRVGGMSISSPRSTRSADSCAGVKILTGPEFSPVRIATSADLDRSPDLRHAADALRFVAQPQNVPPAYEPAFRAFYAWVDEHSGSPTATKPTQTQAIEAARRMEAWIRSCQPSG